MVLELLSPANPLTQAANHRLFCTSSIGVAKSDKRNFWMTVPGKEVVKVRLLPLMPRMRLQYLWFHTLRMAQILSASLQPDTFRIKRLISI